MQLKGSGCQVEKVKYEGAPLDGLNKVGLLYI